MLTEKTRFTLTTIAVAITASLASSSAFADKSQPKTKPEVIVVTGSLLGNSEVADLKTYTGNRSIITADQISRTAARSIDTALQQVPGIKIKDETGTGILPNISVRGLDSSRSGYAQVLLDGIPMTLAPYGHTGQSLFPATLFMIDRIDVARGGASIQYGPNNVGGVINLISKSIPTDWETSVNERMTFFGDSRNLFDTNISTGGAVNDDFSMRFDGNITKGESFREHSETDIKNLMLKTVWNIDEQNSLDATLQYYDAFSELPGALNTPAYEADREQSLRPNDEFNADTKRVALKYNHVLDDSSIIDYGEVDLSVFGNKSSRNFQWDFYDASQDTDGNLGTSWSDTTQEATHLRNSPRDFTVFGIEPTTSLLIDGDISQHIIAGVRYVNEDISYQLNHIDKSSQVATRPRDWQMDTNAMAYYVSNKLGFFDDTLSITPGLRYEDVHMTFSNLGQDYSQDNHVTEWLPGITLGYEFSSNWFAYTNAQRSLRTPQISQLWPKDQTLESELSWNYEAGVRFTPTPRSNLSIAAYRIDFENKIEYDNDIRMFVNIGQTRNQGIELEGTYSPMALPDLILSGSYNYLDTEQLDGEFAGNELAYVSKHQLSASAMYSINEIDLGLMAFYYSKSFSDLANTVEENVSGTAGEVPAYTVVNFNIGTEFFKQDNHGLKVGLSVNNLFDNQYYFRGLDVSPAGRVAAAGRSLSLDVGYTF
ncbi:MULTISPECIES: TonB-dependent siderophore receptor [Shewanella]|uniref:TonB-dependent siderophore receptor n=1 Tax=Shewanella vesiculosa TaxID=518738 RepID=A0ABV0FW26_9GAMM|nr:MULTISPECIES: TonB-dependent siderophore receptor [Shewanella]NCQ45850.1 TonB-dependent siderophore receptor [Shewanella frigidimarina]MBB1390545.1 TonB-dependent siderophore receptor [Shewanella sp. SG44-6]NCO72521.1 TonB-dependent siderophore receptor [Shewanella vesiculosa]NCP36215.1 TonB-dependent siderophore receptor [Shewanella vesiculosa]NCP69536.1 TonB-dependent siderophore receptor [Shewanella vesiculosa]|tara:strand:- start:6260 stop:8392 length:2133 start_codon:yes stop_codon:yes gene_type:complete